MLYEITVFCHRILSLVTLQGSVGTHARWSGQF